MNIRSSYEFVYYHNMTYDTYDIILMGRGKFNICVRLKDKLVHTHLTDYTLSLSRVSI